MNERKITAALKYLELITSGTPEGERERVKFARAMIRKNGGR